MAEELLKLYAQRQAAPGHAFGEDDVWQEEMEAAFPYRETRDQLTAIRDTKRDMEKPRPMDRLVCGDVGFGKTEVALRAAFVAVTGGKQVAFLAPTTLLAEQHYQTLVDRFSKWPVKVAEVSRFRSGKEITAAIKGIGDGTVDIVVGTHKLVPTLSDGLRRIRDYCLPLESERAQHIYGQPSAINKLLTINAEHEPGRITIVLVKQPLGF